MKEGRFFVDVARTWRRSAMPELIESKQETTEEMMY